ncbi:MAG TPA: hypothetical protein VHK91_15270 [Flavisolibacter sp.]|jgi:hypothetical protein|nr:hypothetical protein [Flavisolibacter sp.]
MTRSISRLLKVFLVLISFTHVARAEARPDSWKEMESFHNMVTSIFQSAEENDLNPLKESARHLVLKARQWQKAIVPPRYTGRHIKQTLLQISQLCESIDRAVKQGRSEEVLLGLLENLHNTYHKIVPYC